MIQLEQYRGAKSRHNCPGCGEKGVFARYIKEDGGYLSFEVGRCNRESKCGYHKKPKEFFTENPNRSACSTFKSEKPLKHTEQGGTPETGWNRVEHLKRGGTRKEYFDFIPFEDFNNTLGNYDQNAFVQFLLNLFPGRAIEVQNILKMYFVGTYEDYICFPSIDRSNQVCRAKLIRFNPETGKRLKGEYDTSSLPAKLKLKDFNYKQIFFGEHLLPKFPNKPVSIVEAEKTAIIASLYFPDFIWLGCNSKSWLKAERLKRIGNRKTILYPDADGFELWQSIAFEAQKLGLSVQMSSLIENHATDEQKQNGYDLADYLISQQNGVNEYNSFVDNYNAKVNQIKADEELTAEFNLRLDERISIIEVDGNLSRPEAEEIAWEPGNITQIVWGMV